MSTNMNFIKLSQVTTVCFDIDKAINDSSLTIKKLVILDNSKTESEVSQIISNVLNAVDQHSLFINALKQKYDFKQSSVVKKVLPYEINKEVFGATFTNNKTYTIGLVDDMLLVNKAGIIKRSEEYINQGQDVYVLGQNNNGSFDEEMTPVALIIVKQNIRQSMISSIKWLNENNVDVIVFSSNSPVKTASIAYEAGVRNTAKQTSLDNMSIDAVKNVADKYTVFGDASQEQKEVIVKTLKAKGEKVLMVDSDIDNLSKALENSKRLTANMQRASFFLVSKLLLAVFLIPLLAIVGSFDLYRYFVFDAAIDAFVVMLLMLNNNTETIKGKFVVNIFKKALPGALVMFISALVVFGLYTMQINSNGDFGIYNVQIAITMITISFMALSIVTLYNILLPLSKYHRNVMMITTTITAILLAVSAAISYTTNRADLFFGISFVEMNGPAYLVTAITVILLAGLYITIYRIIDAFKGKDE